MKTTEQFIIDAKKIHSDKYDYSLVNYNGVFKKVCIICPIHGEFWQSPHDHLRGCGCKKCSIDKNKKYLTSNTKEFTERAQIVHNGFYDYSKVEYVNANTKVCIICPIHGEFWQTPMHHLNRNGCPKCRYIKSSNKKRKTTKWFIEESKKIHGNKYDYTKTEYHRLDEKVCIICPIHGEFWQSPANHMKGHGCPYCSKNKKYTLETFIEKARQIHGDKYDYSKVNYVNSLIKVCIICPEHGEFWQTPNCHLNRHQGCPICEESHLEMDIRTLLNEHNIEYNQEYNDKWLGRQYIDFYLPKYNIAIECQGEQHFKLVRFNGIDVKEANKNYNKMLKLDNEKKNKCEKNGVKLLYYSNLKIKYPYKVITDKNKLLNMIKNE